MQPCARPYCRPNQHKPSQVPVSVWVIMQVTGSWMTKIEALLRRLLLMRASDPSAKALVFSQYPDALALISKALNVVQVGGGGVCGVLS